jgi:hypothetical protein
MKIALCISGQMRDEQLSLPAVADLARTLNADVFISTWATRGAKTSGVINLHQAARMFGTMFESVLPRRMIGGDRLLRLFPELERLLDDRSPVDLEALLQWFPGAVIDLEDDTVLDLGFRQPGVEDGNSLRMLYKLWRCNQMKLRRERETGDLYDVVLRTRPDVVPAVSPELMRDVAADDSGRLYLVPEGRSRPDYLNDVAAASGSAGADYYAALFGAALASPERPWRLIHYELAKHLERKGAKVRDLPLAQHITSAWEVRQPRNRELLMAEFERDGRTRLELTEGDHRLLVALLHAMDGLEAGRSAAELLPVLEAVDAQASQPEVLYSLLTGLAWLSASGKDSAHAQVWIACCALLTVVQPLPEHELGERVDGWAWLLARAGATAPAPSSLGELEGCAPEFAGNEPMFQTLRAMSPDPEQYRSLLLRLSVRMAGG